MKIRKTIFAVFAAALMIFPACGEKETGGGDTPPPVPTNPYATVENLFENGSYYLLDFESISQCLEVDITEGMKTEMCSDEGFFKHGESSLKVTIANGGPGWASPRSTPSIGVSCSRKYFQKTNFADCDYFSIEVYNAQDFPVTFWYDVVPLWACGFAQTIQPGWNTVILEGWKCNYGYRANSKEEDMDPEQNYLSEINSFSFKFPSYEEKGKQVYYIDAFTAHKKA